MATGIPISVGELIGVDWLNEVVVGRYRNTTPVTVVNSTTATDLLGGITIEAGAMGTTRTLRLTANGDCLQNSAGSRNLPIFAVTLGGTTLVATAAGSGSDWTSNAGRFPWELICEISNQGATNVQWVNLRVDLQSVFTVGGDSIVAGTGTGYTLVETQGFQASSLICGAGAKNTAGALALALKVTLPFANANLDVTCKSTLVEII